MRQVRGPDATSIMPSEGQTGGSATQKYGPRKLQFPALKLPFVLAEYGYFVCINRVNPQKDASGVTFSLQRNAS